MIDLKLALKAFSDELPDFNDSQALAIERCVKSWNHQIREKFSLT